jgi:hypothetical protein
MKIKYIFSIPYLAVLFIKPKTYQLPRILSYLLWLSSAPPGKCREVKVNFSLCLITHYAMKT